MCMSLFVQSPFLVVLLHPEHRLSSPRLQGAKVVQREALLLGEGAAHANIKRGFLGLRTARSWLCRQHKVTHCHPTSGAGMSSGETFAGALRHTTIAQPHSPTTRRNAAKDPTTTPASFAPCNPEQMCKKHLALNLVFFLFGQRVQ